MFNQQRVTSYEVTYLFKAIATIIVPTMSLQR